MNNRNTNEKLLGKISDSLKENNMMLYRKVSRCRKEDMEGVGVYIKDKPGRMLVTKDEVCEGEESTVKS